MQLVFLSMGNRCQCLSLFENVAQNSGKNADSGQFDDIFSCQDWWKHGYQAPRASNTG